MNCTLFDCGIKEPIETTKGEKSDITSVLPKSEKLQKRPLKCRICKESFAGKKYLDSHVRWKHGSDVNFKSKPVSTPSCTESEEISNKMKSYIEECYGKEEASSLKEVKTGFRDLRNGTVFNSGEEQTRKNKQLMMVDKQSRNFTMT